MTKELFDKLAKQESDFKKSIFLSPVLRDKPIRVRIDGVILSMRVSQPNHFSGWGVFTPKTFKDAILVRQPTMAERRDYLELFPAVRLVLCKNQDNVWYGIPTTNDKVSGLIPVSLPEEVQMFDTVQARFDGFSCWFESIYEKSSLKNSQYLRESFAALLEPKELNLAGLTQPERNAYAVLWETSEESKRTKEENKIKSALNRAGASYLSHIERNDTYTIEYNVDGHTHRSVVRKDTLEVQTAGICLSGLDRTFDLQSLVTVVREGQDRDRY